MLFVLLGAARFIYGQSKRRDAGGDRARACRRADRVRRRGNVILNATGYIVAAHKIELASKVVGKVAWIGVDKGDKVKEAR